MRFIDVTCFNCSEASELEAHLKFIPNRATAAVTSEWVAVCYTCLKAMDPHYPSGVETRPFQEQPQRRLV